MTGDNGPDFNSAFVRDEPESVAPEQGEDMSQLYLNRVHAPQTSQAPVSLLGWGLAFVTGLAIWAMLYSTIWPH